MCGDVGAWEVYGGPSAGGNFRPSSPELRKKRTLNRVGFGNIFIKDTGPSNLNKLQY